MNATTRSPVEAAHRLGIPASDLLNEEASSLASANAKMARAINEAIQHLTHGRPTHALRCLEDVSED